MAMRQNDKIAAGIVGGLIGLGVLGMLFGEKQPADAPSPAAATAPVERKAEMTAVAGWYKAMLAEGEPCDTATTALMDLMKTGGGDRYTAFDRAKDAEDICRASWQKIRERKPPEGLGDAGNETAKGSVERCGDAAYARMAAAKAIGAVFDGDMSPSAVREAKSEIEAIQGPTLGCAAGVVKLADEEGYDMKAFTNAVTGK